MHNGSKRKATKCLDDIIFADLRIHLSEFIYPLDREGYKTAFLPRFSTHFQTVIFAMQCLVTY